MLFNSFTFAVFFVFVYSVYWLNKRSYKRQNFILFAASYIFYGWWDARFLLLLIIATFLDYTGTILIDRNKLSTKQKAKSYAFLMTAVVIFVVGQHIDISSDFPFISSTIEKNHTIFGWWLIPATLSFLVVFEIIQKCVLLFPKINTAKFYLIWSVGLNISLLGIFKYFNFFSENFISLWTWLFGYRPTEITLYVVLPVGISFYIFQTISHIVDVYRKKIPSTSSLLELATYVAFFPQLVAGPIERGANLLPQFQQLRTVTPDQKKEAMWLIAWGLYKKIVVADNVAQIVNNVFQPYDTLMILNSPADGLRCLVAVYAFAVQIYCDFSGYTDIARGTARLLGFKIMLNFNLPYFAITPADFWRRWHISLSSWLRDYLYIPLGGNRQGTIATYRNLILTMLLGGLWHGASWNFVFWGSYHGILLICYNITGHRGTAKELSTANILKGLFMFNLVCLGWLLFRAQNMQTVAIFSEAIVFNFRISPEAIESLKNLLYYSWFLIGYQIMQGVSGKLNFVNDLHWFLRLNIWLFIITSIFRLSQGHPQEFIYFAF